MSENPAGTTQSDEIKVGGHRVCPASHGGWLASGIRRLVHKPEKILSGLILPGQTVADLGCGPGFFTIPMAKMAGPRGCVIAVDVQTEMLEMMMRRAAQAEVDSRIRAHQCGADSLGIEQPVDFALAFAMVHETPDVKAFLGQVRAVLKPGGRLLVAEPKLHVTTAQFAATLALAAEVGLQVIRRPGIAICHAALLGKAEA